MNFKAYHSAAMKTFVTDLVNAHNEAHPDKYFDLYAGDGGCLTIKPSVFMPLVIASLWGNRIAVYHYYIQEGDVMYDPEIVYHITEDGLWIPYSYCQHNLGIYREYIRFNGNTVTAFAGRAIRDLRNFSKTWADNMRWQGFITRAGYRPYTRDDYKALHRAYRVARAIGDLDTLNLISDEHGMIVDEGNAAA